MKLLNYIGSDKFMKILYYTNIPAPYRVKFFNQLSNVADLTVLFNGDRHESYRNKDWFKDNNFNFKYINLKKIALFQLNKILKEPYDIVVIGTYANLNGALLNILLRKKKIKFFLNADGGIVPNKEFFLSKYLKKKFISTADYYLSTGKVTNEYLINYGANKKNIFIYPFSSVEEKDICLLPLKMERKLALRKEAGYNYKRLFVSVGSFIERKGYDLFLSSLLISNNPSNGYLLIGGGEEWDTYQEFIEEHNLKNVHLIDFCSKEEVFAYYKMSDVFFFPSREDIWGLVINEAMSNGLPIIATLETASAREIFKKNQLYSCENIHALNKKINEYSSLSALDLYKEGLNNLEISSKYTIEKMVEKHLEIFKGVMNNEKKN